MCSASEDLNPPLNCSSKAALVATLQPQKRGTNLDIRNQIPYSNVSSVCRETHPEPSECPHKQTRLPLLCVFAHLYR